MVAGSFTKEATSPIAIERLWKASVLDLTILVPKLMPDYIPSVETLEGDGGVGTLKKFNFGPAVKEFKYVTDRLEVLDNENHVIKYSVIEGGLIGLRLKSCSFEIKLEAVSVGGTVSKLTVEYDTLDDTLLSEEEKEGISKGVLGMTKVIEAHLLADPTAYA